MRVDVCCLCVCVCVCEQACSSCIKTDERRHPTKDFVKPETSEIKKSEIAHCLLLAVVQDAFAAKMTPAKILFLTHS